MRGSTEAARWRTTTVAGARADYLEAGVGDPVLFLHGWGLTPRTYAGAIADLGSTGFRVIAPSLPGFGRTGALAADHTTMPGFARWTAGFLRAIGVHEPALVVGHSLGGGVALQLAHDQPELIRSLTLLNTVGGSPPPPTGNRVRVMTARPWWRWAVGVVAEADPREVVRLRPRAVGALAASIGRDVVPNVVRRPRPMLRSALLALTADLAREAQQVVDRGLPVLFVWSDRDRLVTPGALAGVAASLPPETVHGRHGWLLTSPGELSRLLHDALVVQAASERQHKPAGRRAAGTLDSLLAET